MKGKKKDDINIKYSTSAEPKAMADNVPVFCAHDELLPLERIIPNPKNPNQHSKKQINLLSEIIKAQGWRAPITISKRSGFIVTGHGRLKAAYAMGATVAPVDYQEFSNEAEEYAALIADNRIAELSEMDETALTEILSDIAETDLDLILTGYDESDLADLLIKQEEEEEEEEQEEEKEEAPPKKYGVVIICDSEYEQDSIYHELIDRNYRCKELDLTEETKIILDD